MRSFVQQVHQEEAASSAAILPRLAALDVTNERLRLENASLRVENQRVQAEIDQLRSQSDALFATIQALREIFNEEETVSPP